MPSSQRRPLRQPRSRPSSCPSTAGGRGPIWQAWKSCRGTGDEVCNMASSPSSPVTVAPAGFSPPPLSCTSGSLTTRGCVRLLQHKRWPRLLPLAWLRRHPPFTHNLHSAAPLAAMRGRRSFVTMCRRCWRPSGSSWRRSGRSRRSSRRRWPTCRRHSLMQPRPCRRLRAWSTPLRPQLPRPRQLHLRLCPPTLWRRQQRAQRAQPPQRPTALCSCSTSAAATRSPLLWSWLASGWRLACQRRLLLSWTLLCGAWAAAAAGGGAG